VTRRPLRLAVWKLASCDGCQLVLVDCEEELFDLTSAVELARFPEVSSDVGDGPFDLSLVEGSVSTPEALDRVRAIRAASRRLVTIGTCATAGGIQALRNLADVSEYVALVYPRPEYIATLARSTPVSAHVPVDVELPGCPVDRGQLVEVIAAEIAGRRPNLDPGSVCTDCKLAGHVCVPVAAGVRCLGPVTRSGCGALCPAVGRGCYGCFGPKEPGGWRR
jgi:coenzyme F420-reducing hydrogenase gamma subunit